MTVTVGCLGRSSPKWVWQCWNAEHILCKYSRKSWWEGVKGGGMKSFGFPDRICRFGSNGKAKSGGGLISLFGLVFWWDYRWVVSLDWDRRSAKKWSNFFAFRLSNCLFQTLMSVISLRRVQVNLNSLVYFACKIKIWGCFACRK